MLGVKIEDLKITWNSQAILTPAERMTQRLLSSFGAYCRTAWRNSIKRASRKKQRSEPGDPPLHHGTNLLGGGQGYKGTIFFAVDVGKKEVAIGPVLLNGTAGAASNAQPVPQTLEEGGRVTILNRRRGKRRVALLRARPSKQAAFEAAVEKKLPELIANGIMREV